MASGDSGRNPVERLAEEFLDRYRAGERPSLSEYTGRYPDLAGEIRELFPALVMMEEVGNNLTVDASAATKEAAEPGRPDRLGDYRILREVGRGGMGVVYEAEQEALGRKVALKVLPAWASLDPVRLQRFRREARSAARLHHTNIVPVFDVGQCQGTHYYAMQFIQGQGLDEVLQEMRRLRGTGGEGRRADVPPAGARVGAPEGRSLASALLTGEFAPRLEEQGAATIPGGGHRTAPPTTAPGASDLTGSSDRDHFRGVARVGLQAAEALAFAHAQRVLHRDIKPSNLMIDHQGVVWVTDFGLATEEGSDLTGTGDIVGTLRYLPPERLNGQVDARGDIYSLGLTLYELLTLRPAFEESDRGRLIGQITHDDPPRPRKLDLRIPRDLETVVLKAIAKDPSQRYRTAGELAEDLRRFVTDRPIQARRISTWERTWRWCRRNPILALMTGAAMALGVVSLFAAVWLKRVAEQARLAERDATEKLFHSSVAEARANHFGGRMGQRHASLRALRQAVDSATKLGLGPDRFLELRTAAIASLAMLDLEVEAEWEGNPPGTNGLAFDSRYDRYARSHQDGSISLRRVADDAELRRIQATEAESLDRRVDLQFAGDDRFLLATYQLRTGRPVSLFDLDTASSPPWTIHPTAGFGDFTPDGKSLVVGRPDHSISLHDLRTGKEVGRLPAGRPVGHLAVHPQGALLAVSTETRVPPPQAPQPDSVVQIRHLGTGEILKELEHKTGIQGVAWGPADNTLAAAGMDHRIYVWDVSTGSLVRTLTGHDWEVFRVRFSHSGEWLASSGYDLTTRIWNVRTGKQLLLHPSYRWVGFSRDDRRTAFVESRRVKVCRLTPSLCCRTLYGHKGVVPDLGFSPDGRLLASGGLDGVRVWESSSGRNVAHLKMPSWGGVLFERSGNGLLTYNSTRLVRWRLGDNFGAGLDSRPNPPPSQLVLSRNGGYGIGRLRWCGKSAKLLAMVAEPNGLHLVDLEAPDHDVWKHDSPGWTVFPDCSPDGRWLATGAYEGRGCRVYEAATGKLVMEWPMGDTKVAFSPDGRWLVTGTGNTSPDGACCSFWRVGSWELVHRIPTDRTSSPSDVMFSEDGKLLAIASSLTAVTLIDPATFQVLATFHAHERIIISYLALSGDGTLLAVGTADNVIQLWDLRELRRQLAEMNLDW